MESPMHCIYRAETRSIIISNRNVSDIETFPECTIEALNFDKLEEFPGPTDEFNLKRDGIEIDEA